jgi:leader peptidase (prepilin peptidase) / N-methyltransferase
MLVASAALLGLLLGSLFATVVIRVPAGRPTGLARSCCDTCGGTLSWFELVPVMSWATFGGRCRRCGARIAMIHPILEVASMLTWIAALYLAPGDLHERMAWALLGTATLALLWSDLADGLLPDLLVGTAAFAGLGRAAIHQTLIDSAVAATIAGGLLLLVRWAFLFLRRREALGLGDVKLFAALAIWMQPQDVGPALLVASLTTLMTALVVRVPPYREIPFGPGLLLGAWVALIAL